MAYYVVKKLDDEQYIKTIFDWFDCVSWTYSFRDAYRFTSYSRAFYYSNIINQRDAVSIAHVVEIEDEEK